MNLKQRINLNDLDPRDPDHDDLEELKKDWVQKYMEEYAEHGTMAGEDATDLELDTELEKLREKGVFMLVSADGTPSQMAEAWGDYGCRLCELIYESAEETVGENWEEIKREALERYNDL